MRPLLSYLGALPVRTGVFAATSDFGGPGAAALTARVTQAAEELASAMVGTQARVKLPCRLGDAHLSSLF